MLVLVRRSDESILIGDRIAITVLAVDGDRVKLGIEAPREVSILRQELCDEVGGQNRAAAESSRALHQIFPSLKRRLSGNREAETR